jgi:hypothetical protein
MVDVGDLAIGCGCLSVLAVLRRGQALGYERSKALLAAHRPSIPRL